MKISLSSRHYDTLMYFCSMQTKKEKISNSFKKYLPEEAIPYVIRLLFSYKLSFRIVKPRKTKLGDYRPPFEGKNHRITINGDLNPYAFLITTLHEFAHLTTFEKYGRKVQAHGKEWKAEFKTLLEPILKEGYLPSDIKMALQRNLNNLKASSCTDIHLYRVLKNYDENADSILLLEEVSKNSYFRLNNKVFQRGELRRTRYLCEEVGTGKKYLINRLAEVEQIKDTE